MPDHNGESENNIALLIDADNASPEHLDEALLVLGELGTINIRRAYGNWAKASLKGWGGLTGSHSIVPVQQFDVVKGKSVTDMRMTIDAMDLLYRGHVDGFVDVGALALGDDEDCLEQPATAKGQRPVDQELLQVLGSAYKASKRDEEGYTPLSELGQRAKAVSSFAARNYGFTRLSELIKAVPNFEVKAGDDGGLLVKRLR